MIESEWQVVLEPMEGYDDHGNNDGGLSIRLRRDVTMPTLPDPRPVESASAYKDRCAAAIETWIRSSVTEREVCRVGYDRKHTENPKKGFDRVLRDELKKAEVAAERLNEYSRPTLPGASRLR